MRSGPDDDKLSCLSQKTLEMCELSTRRGRIEILSSVREVGCLVVALLAINRQLALERVERPT